MSTTLQDFRKSLSDEFPMKEWPLCLKALWHEGKGDWHKAHSLVENGSNREMAWVHAYLHRKEGDRWNAEYWYRQAHRQMPNVSLEEEWGQLVDFFLTTAGSR